MHFRLLISFAQGRDRESRTRRERVQVDVGIVLAEQPDRDVEASLREHPERIAGTDAMNHRSFDLPMREEFFLHRAVVFDAHALEVFRAAIREIEPKPLLHDEGFAVAEIVDASKATSAKAQPFSVVPERFIGLDVDRAIAGHSVVGGVGQQAGTRLDRAFICRVGCEFRGRRGAFGVRQSEAVRVACVTGDLRGIGAHGIAGIPCIGEVRRTRCWIRSSRRQRGGRIGMCGLRLRRGGR